MVFLSALKQHRKVYITLVSFTTVVLVYNEGLQFWVGIQKLSMFGWFVGVIIFTIAINMAARLRIWVA